MTSTLLARACARSRERAQQLYEAGIEAAGRIDDHATTLDAVIKSALARASLATATRAYVEESARALRLTIHAGRALRREIAAADASTFRGHLFVEVGPPKPALRLVGDDDSVST